MILTFCGQLFFMYCILLTRLYFTPVSSAGHLFFLIRVFRSIFVAASLAVVNPDLPLWMYRRICLLSKSLRIRRSLVKLSGLVKAVTKMVTGCLRTMKVAKFVLGAKSCFSELRKICDFLYACHLLFRSRVYFTLSNLISLPWRRFGWVLFHHFRLIVYFCPQKCWFTLCNRAGGGSTGRRQTGATAQSTSALTLERSSIFLSDLKMTRSFKTGSSL